MLLVINVYGPSTDNRKPNFIQELRGLLSLVQHPWILGSDFNLVRWLIDRSSDGRSFRLISLFNDLIRDLQLFERIDNSRGLVADHNPLILRLIEYL